MPEPEHRLITISHLSTFEGVGWHIAYMFTEHVLLREITVMQSTDPESYPFSELKIRRDAAILLNLHSLHDFNFMRFNSPNELECGVDTIIEVYLQEQGPAEIGLHLECLRLDPVTMAEPLTDRIAQLEKRVNSIEAKIPSPNPRIAGAIDEWE